MPSLQQLLCDIALKTAQRKIFFHFLCETAHKALPHPQPQTPILNAGAITLIWCTALGRNFP